MQRKSRERGNPSLTSRITSFLMSVMLMLSMLPVDAIAEAQTEMIDIESAEQTDAVTEEPSPEQDSQEQEPAEDVEEISDEEAPSLVVAGQGEESTEETAPEAPAENKEQIIEETDEDKNQTIEAQADAIEDDKADQKAKASAATVTMGSFSGRVSTSGGSVRYRFVPPTSGTYVFESFAGGDTIGSILDSSGNVLVSNDDGGEDRNFMVSCSLQPNVTYYLEASFYGSGTGSMSLSLSRRVSSGTLTAKVATAGAHVRLRFTPSSSGTYVFESVSSSDTYGYLYGPDGATLASNDDDGDGLNFKIERSLQAGKAYFVEAYYLSSSATGTFKVRIANASVAPPRITSQPSSVTVDDGQTATFSVSASGTGLSYKWQTQFAGETTWRSTGFTGNATRTLSVAAKSAYSGRKYRCVVTDSAGQKATSSAATLTVRERAVTNYRSLLVGNTYYYDDDPLYGCDNDMKAMGGMLRGLSNTYRTNLRPDKTASQIKSAIKATFAEADSDDVSLFYYSGHGCEGLPYLDPDHGALVGVDGSLLTTNELAEELSKVPGKVIVILDSCFSGAAIAKSKSKSQSDLSLQIFNQQIIDTFASYDKVIPVNGQLPKSGELCKNKFVVLTASSFLELSYSVDGDVYSYGDFTYTLLHGLGCSYPHGSYTAGYMSADTNNNSRVTLGEAWSYVRDNTDKQTCQMYGSESEVLFSRA